MKKLFNTLVLIFITTYLNAQCVKHEALIADTIGNCTDSVTMTLKGSQLGVSYYLINAQTKSILDGPKSGTNDSLDFNSGPIINSTSYQIIANIDSNTALNFNGINENASIPSNNLLRPTNAITIEAWIYPNDISTNALYEIYRKEDGNERHLLAFQDGGNTLSFGIATNGVYRELDVPINPADFENQWVHIAATYDGSKKRVYRNGIEIGDSSVTGTMSGSGTANSYIGSNSGLSEFFNGKIDELKVWSIARDSAQINKGMNPCFTLNTNGLLLYLNMNDSAGGTIKDQSGKGLNATILKGTGIHINPDTVWSKGQQELVSNVVLVPKVIFVDSAAVGLNNGTCWINGYNYLQDALKAAKMGDQIWVANGTYFPDDGAGYTNKARDSSFYLKNGVHLYGGFSGVETKFEERDWAKNATILSGNIGGNDSTDNSYTVLKAIFNIGEETTLDGFTIRDGYNDTKQSFQNVGGIYTLLGSISINNCNICHNTSFIDSTNLNSSSLASGGVMTISNLGSMNNCIIQNNYCSITKTNNAATATGVGGFYGSGLSLSHCKIMNNSCFVSGKKNILSVGGISLGGGNLLHSIISENTAEMITETQTSNIAFSIGGAYTSGANSIVSNCNISYNYSQGFLKGSNISPVVGGFMHQNSSGGSKILNSVINNNLSNTLKISSFWCPGGMFLSYGNNFEVINCVISNNNTIHNSNGKKYNAPPVYALDGRPIFSNCIFWNNLGDRQGIDLRDITFHNTNPVFKNSMLEMDMSSITAITFIDCIINKDPIFLNKGSAPISKDTMGVQANFRLQAGSLARNAGSSNFLPMDILDLNKNGNTTELLPIDYNFQPRINECNVDMGAYEHQGGILPVLKDSIVCTDGSPIIIIGEGTDLKWYKDSLYTMLVATGDTLKAVPNIPKLYTYYLTDTIMNCSRKRVDTVIINVLNKPIISLGADTSFCAGDSILIEAGNWSSYKWNTLATTKSIYAKTGGYYDVTISDTTGCKNTDSLLVTENQLPTPNLGKDTTISIKDTIILNPGRFLSYLWSDLSTDSSLKIIGSSVGAGVFTFSAEVRDNNQCKNSDTLILTITDTKNLDELGIIGKINYYPNPFTDEIVIDLIDNNVNKVLVEVMDYTGKVVDKVELTGNKIILDLTQESPGLYLVRISTLNWNKTLKIVKK